MDEKGFMLGILPETKRYFTGLEFTKGRLKGSGQDVNREWVTVIASICQDMTALPPLVVYTAATNNILDTWVQELRTDQREIYFTTSPTGWTNNDIVFEWLTIFDRHTKERASNGLRWRLLFADGHSSHLYIYKIKKLDRQGIEPWTPPKGSAFEANAKGGSSTICELSPA
jgi:hypothetical protein